MTVSGRSNSGSELESERIELNAAATAVAQRSARAVGIELAGVDLVVDEVGDPLAVLEVNTGPGLHRHVCVRNGVFDPFSAILSRLDPD